MGEPFAEHLVKFARTQGVVASEVAKIEKNPDQSKHLETATFRILDRSIDVVNLRSEEYTGDSRIPNQVVSTPDPRLRDTRSEEWYCSNTITAEETFLDDPLRVIRCVRFASRFDFAMEPELETAVKDPIIQAALRTKVSRERVGEELTKMVKALTPYKGITYSDRKKKPHPAVEAAIRESLKLGTQNHFLDGIPALFAAAEILQLPRLDDDRFALPSDRVAIGLRLRDKIVHNSNTGSHWTSSLLFSLVQDLLPHYDLENDILDGQVLDQVVEWQLGHPHQTKDDCIAWLRTQQAAGKIIINQPSEPVTKKLRTK
ncbi:CCA tRNA nucleotidyltransferase [Salix suchowensis]|nr:CCA tRNA nucleotidyltransferase [Salix suchowensis]